MAWRLWRLCDLLSRSCKAIARIYKDAPTLCLVVIAIAALLVLILVLFSTCLARLLGAKGAVTVDLLLFWLFARLVARALMFPGSLKIFQRSTEANYRREQPLFMPVSSRFNLFFTCFQCGLERFLFHFRRVEVARHYIHYVRHLWHFLRYASRVSESSMKGVTLEGLARRPSGCDFSSHFISLLSSLIFFCYSTDS